MKKILLAMVLVGGLVAGGFYDEPDKEKHFAVGAGISTVANLYYQIQGDNVFISTLKGIGWSLVAGLAKESYDKGIKNKTFDNDDVKATLNGGALFGTAFSTATIPFRIAFGVDTKKQESRLLKLKKATK